MSRNGLSRLAGGGSRCECVTDRLQLGGSSKTSVFIIKCRGRRELTILGDLFTANKPVFCHVTRGLSNYITLHKAAPK